MRTLIDYAPFAETFSIHHWETGRWPANWVSCPEAEAPPLVTAYRLAFDMAEEQTVRVHVTSDERYELFLDGERIGRGSERGDPNNWFFETYDLALTSGPHRLVARVWSLGVKAPFAQMSVRPGFLLAAEGAYQDTLSTGKAPWETKKLGGYEYLSPRFAFGVGWNVKIHGADFDWDFELGEGDRWQPVRVGEPAQCGKHDNEYSDRSHHLRPAILPAMMEEPRQTGMVRFSTEVHTDQTESIQINEEDHDEAIAEIWAPLLTGEDTLTIPANVTQRVIIDLREYYCAYPELTVSSGAGSRIRIHWAEALMGYPVRKVEYGDCGGKGNRNEVFGRYFIGLGDVFLPDGGAHRTFDTLWWQAGRYIEFLVETGSSPLTLEHFSLRETRYPMELESDFIFSDNRMALPIPIMVRGLQMCSHETYMDCPYYEQLMYVGDTRLEVLATYAITSDDRLPRKAVRIYDSSRIATLGLTQSRYPCRTTQFIPPFSLWWTAMVHDYALWRDDEIFVRDRMPGVRSVLDTFWNHLNPEGLLIPPEGLQFTDWVPGWRMGIPAAADPEGVSALLNWHFVLVLTLNAQLESWLGETLLAQRSLDRAKTLAAKLDEVFWDDDRKLCAEDPDRKHPYTEHTQCLAILSGLLGEQRESEITQAMLDAKNLEQTTIYFSHYLFEVLAKRGEIATFMDRLKLWFDLEPNGFKTTFEQPGDTRSDCHGWGAHPLYHYYATVLGVRPAEMGFKSVRIRPQLGPLEFASGKLVHPQGVIEVDFRQKNGRVIGSVTLPEGVTGELCINGTVSALKPGKQAID
jgi:hypothetical protein